MAAFNPDPSAHIAGITCSAAGNLVIPYASIAALTLSGDVTVANGDVVIEQAAIAALTDSGGNIVLPAADVAAATQSGDITTHAGDILVGSTVVAAYRGELVIPLSSIPELTAAEAHPTTGDIRKLMFALIDMLYTATKAAAWASADTPPAKLLSYRSTSINDSTNVVTRNYSQAIEVSGTFEVADEA